jgi:hypothetical protein
MGSDLPRRVVAGGVEPEALAVLRIPAMLFACETGTILVRD